MCPCPDFLLGPQPPCLRLVLKAIYEGTVGPLDRHELPAGQVLGQASADRSVGQFTGPGHASPGGLPFASGPAGTRVIWVWKGIQVISVPAVQKQEENLRM